MRADLDTADEGSVAIMTSRDILMTDNIKCLSFKYYMYGNKNPGSLKVPHYFHTFKNLKRQSIVDYRKLG